MMKLLSSLAFLMLVQADDETFLVKESQHKRRKLALDCTKTAFAVEDDGDLDIYEGKGFNGKIARPLFYSHPFSLATAINDCQIVKCTQTGTSTNENQHGHIYYPGFSKFWLNVDVRAGWEDKAITYDCLTNGDTPQLLTTKSRTFSQKAECADAVKYWSTRDVKVSWFTLTKMSLFDKITSSLEDKGCPLSKIQCTLNKAADNVEITVPPLGAKIAQHSGSVGTDPYFVMYEPSYEFPKTEVILECKYDGNHLITSPAKFNLEITTQCKSYYALYENSRNDDTLSYDYFTSGVALKNVKKITSTDRFKQAKGFDEVCKYETCTLDVTTAAVTGITIAVTTPWAVTVETQKLWDAGTAASDGTVTVEDIQITCNIKDGIEVTGDKFKIKVKQPCDDNLSIDDKFKLEDSGDYGTDAKKGTDKKSTFTESTSSGKYYGIKSADKINCPFDCTTCKLYKTDGTTELPSDNTKITWGFGTCNLSGVVPIFANLDTPLGWTESFRFGCTKADGYNDITYTDQFKFTQKKACAEASNVKMIKQAGAIDSVSASYGQVIVDTVFSEYVATLSACPITYFELVICKAKSPPSGCVANSVKSVEVVDTSGKLSFTQDVWAGQAPKELIPKYTQEGNAVSEYGTPFTYEQKPGCWDNLALKADNSAFTSALSYTYGQGSGSASISTSDFGMDFDARCKLKCTIQMGASLDAADSAFTFDGGAQELRIKTNTFAGFKSYEIKASCTTTTTGTKTTVVSPTWTVSVESQCEVKTSTTVKAISQITKAYKKDSWFEIEDVGVDAPDVCELECILLSKADGTASDTYKGANQRGKPNTIKKSFSLETTLGYKETMHLLCTNNKGVEARTSIDVEQTTSCLSSFTRTGVTGNNLGTIPMFDYKSVQVARDNGLASEDAKGNCAITSCKLLFEDSNRQYADYTGDKVSIQSVAPFKITYNSNIKVAYSKFEFYVQCENGDQTYNSMPIEISQDEPCRSTLTATDIPDQALQFDRNVDWKKIPMSSFMVSNDLELCKVQSCKIQYYGRETIDGKMKISDDGPNNFGVWFARDFNPINKAGWKLNDGVSIQCTNGVQTVQTSVFQAEQYANPCRQSLSIDISKKPASLTGANSIAYNPDETNQWTTPALDFAPMFTNSQPNVADCKETCILQDDSCSADEAEPKRFQQVTTDNLVNQYSVEVMRNFAEGYEKTVCLKCTNKDDAKDTNIEVKQILRCHERLTKKDKLPVMGNMGTVDDENVLWYTGKAGWVPYTSDTADHFFINDNHDDKCPITTCSLMKPGCTEVAEASDNVRVHQYLNQNTWKMEVNLNKPLGYIEHYCVSCTNGNATYTESVLDANTWPRQTINWDNFRVQLPSVCNRAMTINATTAPSVTFNHDDNNVGDQVFPDGFDLFFKNSEKTNCPVQTCTLLTKGCGSRLTNSNIFMDAAKPWAIKIQDNTENGYGPDEFCVMCDNEYQKIQFDNISVKQEARCKDKLFPKTWTQTAEWEYVGNSDKTVNTSPQVFVADGWKSFFTNSDVDSANFCNPVTCSLRQANCVWPLNSPSLSMGPAPLFKISRTEKKYGLSVNACVYCRNNFSGKTSKFTVKQKSICDASYKQLTKGPLPEVKEGEDPNKNPWAYEMAYDQKMNMFDIGFDATSETKNVTWQHYFKVEDPTDDCAFDKCELMGKGCLYPYTATTHIKIGKTAPWTVSAHSDIADGYNTTFCIKCTNSGASINQDDIVVTQHGKTPWTMILVLVAVAIWLVIGFTCFCFGKITNTDNVVAEAEDRSNQQAKYAEKDKVVNKENQEDFVEPPVQQVELTEFHQEEIVGQKQDLSDDDAPESVQSASFYKRTSVLNQQPVEDGAGFGTERALNNGGETNR